MSLALTLMSLALELMSLALELMDFALELMDFVLKLIPQTRLIVIFNAEIIILKQINHHSKQRHSSVLTEFTFEEMFCHGTCMVSRDPGRLH